MLDSEDEFLADRIDTAPIRSFAFPFLAFAFPFLADRIDTTPTQVEYSQFSKV